jgi:hypothetical protein
MGIIHPLSVSTKVPRVPQITEIVLNLQQHMKFQYIYRMFFKVLNISFPRWWIGRNGLQLWSPWSLDLKTTIFTLELYCTIEAQ